MAMFGYIGAFRIKKKTLFLPVDIRSSGWPLLFGGEGELSVDRSGLLGEGNLNAAGEMGRRRVEPGLVGVPVNLVKKK